MAGPAYGGYGGRYSSYGTGYGAGRYAPTHYSSAYSTPATSYNAPATSGGYRTNQTYQPGDGYVYPLYYNPATRSYYYYPVAR
jgi:hypothetical protein